MTVPFVPTSLCVSNTYLIVQTEYGIHSWSQMSTHSVPCNVYVLVTMETTECDKTFLPNFELADPLL